MTTKKTRLNAFAVIFFTACVVFSLSADQARADDFGKIVRHIEVNYHVHRNHRFLMGFAGLVVKFWHVGGVKSLKAAIFEDQHLDATDADARLDEIVQSASEHGWHPLVKSYSRRSGEHSYIYVQDLGKDIKDIRMLIVSVEPNEAAVLQLKLDPDKLARFMDEDIGEGSRHDVAMTFR
jgi:hypothetical protein